MKTEIKNILREQAANTPATVSTRGSKDASKGGNVTINTNAPTVVTRTGKEYENRGTIVNVIDTSKTYTK